MRTDKEYPNFYIGCTSPQAVVADPAAIHSLFSSHLPSRNWSMSTNEFSPMGRKWRMLVDLLIQL